MNKYEEALNSIKESYDAFYLPNKYGDYTNEGTHAKEFQLLALLKGDKARNAIAWIACEYDCYYKDEYADETGTAFEYLRKLCREVDE